MNKFYITQGDGILIFRTSSIDHETANKFYETELQLHRYNNISLTEYNLEKILRTTDAHESADNKIKQDKFRK